MPDGSTRYVGGATGNAYTKTVTAYDTLGRTTSTDLTLPSDDSLVTSGAVIAFQGAGKPHDMEVTFRTVIYRNGYDGLGG
ncbi:hypothetical protein [Streptomyces atratus]|uniref:hypothetical protein n=1 Tax=Streptomyces atratus TaxID=1893 RepID=UPI0033D79F65